MVALLLLPGLDGTGLLFEEFVASLGGDVEPIIVAYPIGTPLDYAELESITRASMPKNKPFFLLGESFSGPIALSIAATSPPGLLGVVLCCSFARNPLPIPAPAHAILRRLPVASLPVSLLSFFLMGRFTTEKLRRRLTDVMSRVAPEVLRLRAHEALSVDVTAVLRDVHVPLLYLRARKDRVVGKRSADEICAAVSNAVMVEFEAPHFLLQTLPGECAATVIAFITAHTKKAP